MAVTALKDRFARITVWQAALTLAIVAYTWYFTSVTLDVHHGLGTSSYDLGLYDQGVWLMSRFKAPFITLMGRNLMGDHASFILVLLVPLYWLFPAVGTLLLVQSLVIALGAVPVFLLARKCLESEAMAFVLAGLYLLHPAVGWTNRENFHPDCFLALFVGMAVYAAVEHKWRVYGVFVVLSLLVKEDVSLVVVPLGLWVGMRRDRRIGMATVVGSLAVMLVGMLVVMRGLTGVPTRNAWRIPFAGPWGVVREVIARPGNVFQYFRSEYRPFYLWQMSFPTAFVFLRRPDISAISAVVLGTNVLSTFSYQHDIQYHYSLIAVPALVVGTAYALAAFGHRTRRRLVGLVATTTVWSCLMWGAVPLGSILTPGAKNPIGHHLPSYWPPSEPIAVAAREMIAAVPAGASVSTYHSLTPHLTRREQIYMFPNPFRVVLYGPDTSLESLRACLPAANDLEYVLLQAEVPETQTADWDKVKGDFEPAASNDSWVLYHRVRHDVQCVNGSLNR